MSKPENIGNPEENAVKHSVMRSDEANAASSAPAADTAADGHIPAEKKISNAPENAEKKPPSPEENDGGVDNTPAAPEGKKAGEDSAGIEKAIKKEAEKQIKKETGKEPEKEMKTETEKAAEKPPFFREELRPLRGESRKVFRRSDGMEEAVFYARPVHLPDGRGGFSDETTALPEPEKDGKHYLCDAGAFRARFSREQNDGELFTMEKGRYRVTLTAAASRRKRKKCLCAALCERHGKEDPHRLSFADAEPGADYTYHVGAEGVKEDIVIREKADSYRFPFLVHCEHLRATAERGGKRIALCDEESGEEIFHIPAPFMCDAAGARSEAVRYQLRTEADGTTHLTVVADSDFINAADRVFPVTVDPQIVLSGSAACTTYLYENSLMGGNSESALIFGKNQDRLYIVANRPTLSRNPRISKAWLTFTQKETNLISPHPTLFALYRVTGDIVSGATTPPEMDIYNIVDYARMVPNEDGKEAVYRFDITSLIDTEEEGDLKLVLKVTDEKTQFLDRIRLYAGLASAEKAPKITVEYQCGFDVKATASTVTYPLGRYGEALVDPQRGNLMFVSTDVAWSGLRMPVTIRHLYNHAFRDINYTQSEANGLRTADFSAMKLGLGMKLNLMQSMVPASFPHNGQTCQGYVYTDEYGCETCFAPTRGATRFKSVAGGDYYQSDTRIMTKDKMKYLFDTAGRLTKITDAYKNHLVISYGGDDRIHCVTDGAGRNFTFSYDNDGYLTQILCPDASTRLYGYSSGRLSSVKFANGEVAYINYNTGGLPASISLTDLYRKIRSKTKFGYSSDGERLHSITDYGEGENDRFVAGTSMIFARNLAARSARITRIAPADGAEVPAKRINEVYTFDDNGNVISRYLYTSDSENAESAANGSGIHPFGDQSTFHTVVNGGDNLLFDHNFAASGWTKTTGECGCEATFSTLINERGACYGDTVHIMSSECETISEQGLWQLTRILPAGEYTFSAHLKVTDAFTGPGDPGVFLRVTKTDGTPLCESEHLRDEERDYARPFVSFTLPTEQSVKVQILFNGCGTVCYAAAQLEPGHSVNAYNLLQGGGFEDELDFWQCSHNYIIHSDRNTYFNMKTSAFIHGDLQEKRYLSQCIFPAKSADTRETYTLSGWAMGRSLPSHDRKNVTNAPIFRLRAEVEYANAVGESIGSEDFVADFSPCTQDWQKASVQFSKSMYNRVRSITVYCEYGYNSGEAYFDNIQLIRNSVETGLSAADFPFDDLMGDAGDTGSSTAGTVSLPEFKEARDSAGNPLTETVYHTGESGTLYRSFSYHLPVEGEQNATTRNDPASETDERGNSTQYTYAAKTSYLTEKRDRTGRIVSYGRDVFGHPSYIVDKKPDGTLLSSVNYNYDMYDRAQDIWHNGMKYVTGYNAFHYPASFGLHGMEKPLESYTYRKGTGQLQEIAYANGCVMKAAYNSVGQMVTESWYAENAEGTLVETARYLYAYDGAGNVVRSLDIYAQKEYNYQYEGDRILRAAECNVTLSGDTVLGRTLVNTVRCTYDPSGRLCKKTFTPTGAPSRSVCYEYDENGHPAAGFKAGGRDVTCHSGTDVFGRKVFDEVQTGVGVISRQYSYCRGQYTEQHTASGKIRSTPTTSLVERIVFADGRTLSYQYDAEERITSVTDTYTVNGTETTRTVQYAYDALGQLTKETVNGIETSTVTYDNCGNILSKNGVAYTYGNSIWKDQITAVGGSPVTYDAQGNPLSFSGHTLTWEKARQLKSFDSHAYTYNACGVRTSKTVGGIRHTYSVNGTQILREAWGSHVLIPLYNNEDSLCGILYDNTPYYFLKNLQNDIIGMTNEEGETVVRYTYDAWGVCTVVIDTSGCSVSTVNPFRFRGYYYDAESGLYYLGKRYYSPVWGRFINPDQALPTREDDRLSLSLYCYCANDPVNHVDPDGRLWWAVLLCIVSFIVAVVAVAHVVNAAVALSNKKGRENLNRAESAYTQIINNQKAVPIASIRFGLFTVADKGCGAVAAHNALLCLGFPSNFLDVIEFMEPRDLTLGKYGIYFTNIQLYFSRKHIHSRVAFKHRAEGHLDQMIKASRKKTAILAFRHELDGHFVAVQYEDGKGFFMYNNNGKGTTAAGVFLPDPASFVPSIDGWMLSQRAANGGKYYYPLCLITF